MSMIARPRSSSQSSRRSNRSNTSLPAPAPSLTPLTDGPFTACAATASFLLYAQHNVILCLHHDTLAIERRFERHRQPVQWISVDNASERGNGRLVVSYDASQTTIVWDLLTGDEVARFASYEEIRIAAWMRNGNIAFGNSQGNVILFEPATVEHISARTIFDPITALAPGVDCRTFAIGYQNGSILIAALQPSFTILHTLSTTRPPSPMNALAWHGSSSKQKSDMLAAQTADGDLRIWSIPKTSHSDPPNIIRVLHRPENDKISGPCWFGWSKMGRIVQYSDNLTFVWDVRTKRITYESVPTVDGIVGIANYGPTATLFTLGRNHTVQQYDLNPNARAPLLVQNVQHVPSKLPPSPPTSDPDQGNKGAAVTAGATDPRAIYFEAESGGEEGVMTMSPLQRGAQEMHELEDERRDQLGALSPVSSKSSLSSRSAGALHSSSSHTRQLRTRSSSHGKLVSARLPNEKPPSPGMGSTGSSYTTGTTFSSGAYRTPLHRNARESTSIRTMTSGSSVQKSSRLRQEVTTSPDTPASLVADLFPYTKARLSEVQFQAPTYGQDQRTPGDLRRQMLRVVFGWHDDIEGLIRDELSRHPPGSASSVLLSKWLGDLGDDVAASMSSSNAMTYSDWMLLALSSIGNESQKRVGETYVDRLLAKGDIHPAVTILLGLGEYDEAVEAYVSRKYFMEAVLLVCLIFPLDWGRQSHLVRRWGEQAVSEEPKQTELAVRCFSCTSVESSEPWFSPRAQDAIYAAQQAILGPSSPNSYPSVPSPKEGRLHPSQAGLKLVTSFGQDHTLDPLTVIDDKTPMTYVGGVTPIDSSVISPGGVPYVRLRGDSARTATPGGYERRRFPSRDAAGRAKRGADGLASVDESTGSAAPLTAFKSPNKDIAFHHRRNRSASTGQSPKATTITSGATRQSPKATTITSGATSYHSPDSGSMKGRNLPSPAHGIFTRFNEKNTIRNGSRDRKPDGLQLHVDDVVLVDSSLPSGATTTQSTTLLSESATGTTVSIPMPPTRSSRRTAQSADAELKSAKIRSIDEFINSLDVGQTYSKHQPRPPSKHRSSSKDGKALAPARRTPSETRGRAGVRYVKPAKRSPSSPISMSPDDPALMPKREGKEFDDERYYKMVAPVEAQASRPRDRSNDPIPVGGSARTVSRTRRTESAERQGARMRSTSRHASKASSSVKPSRPDDEASETRGRSKVRREGSANRSSSALASKPSAEKADDEEEAGIGRRRTSANRTKSPDHRLRERSRSAKPPPLQEVKEDAAGPETPARTHSRPEIAKLVTDIPEPFLLSKKELAAQELEARRLSLTRRPSAPAIPHPDEFTYPKSAIEPGNSPGWDIPSERQLLWNAAIDPETQLKVVSSTSGFSTFSAPIGLPATPRAMRHPKYMHSPIQQDAPEIPDIPPELSQRAMRHPKYMHSPIQQDAPEIPDIPPELSHLTAVPTQQPPSQPENAEPPAILPATTFQPTRSASAPTIAKSPPTPASSTLPQPISRREAENVQPRKPSLEIKAIHPPGSSADTVESPIVGNIGETLSSVVVVEALPGSPTPSAVLPELQHLAGPPPPPPPPTMFRSGHASSHSLGTIDPADARHPTPAAMTLLQHRQTTPIIDQQPPSVNSSPNAAHRRGRGSVSDSVGQKLRSVTQRMRERSSSRNRTKSPPTSQLLPQAAPYESAKSLQTGAKSPTVQKPTSPTGGRVLMPYETGYFPPVAEAAEIPRPEPPTEPLPSVPFGGYRTPKDIARAMTQEQMQFGESTSAAAGNANRNKTGMPFVGYRDPKEIRANMPPEQLQMGVTPAAESGDGKG